MDEKISRKLLGWWFEGLIFSVILFLFLVFLDGLLTTDYFWGRIGILITLVAVIPLVFGAFFRNLLLIVVKNNGDKK